MRVLRIYHAGRDAAHRGRERALVGVGVEVTLALPEIWPGPDALGDEPFGVVQLPVRRPGDVNRHTYEPAALQSLLDRPWDLVDVHAEPFSAVVHQVLRQVPEGMPLVTYTAQNLDKRWPPPFHQWEAAALHRVGGIYPCVRQAGAVVRRRGFTGHVRVLPLGTDPALIHPGAQHLGEPLVCGLVGRLVPEKGVLEAVRAVAAVDGSLLLLVGEGPELPAALALAASLRVDVEHHPWVDAAQLGELYRRMHVVLVPSRSTSRWVEQFGRTVTEGRGCGAVVVATASGSLPEVVGSIGVLVPEGVALGPALRALLSDPERWGRLRAEGLAAVQTWDDVASGQRQLYDDALSGAPVTFEDLGAPAQGAAGMDRPFALPWLREGGRVARGLGGIIDATAARVDAARPHRRS
jgi:glycosyltransferase involved in cell wall biosynthesis